MGKRRLEGDFQVVSGKPALAEAAAESFISTAESAIAGRGRFLVALSGGSTPQAMFSLLAAPGYRSRIDWTQVFVYWGDERMVIAEDPGSNYYEAHRLLLDHVPIPENQIYRMRGEMPVEEAIVDYENQLLVTATSGREWPIFDLAIMGLGADGHTASLFPGSDTVNEAERPVVAVTADYQGRPANRLTLTAPVFNDSRAILFLVSGEDKSNALANVLRGPEDIQTWPAQVIQPKSGNLTWLVDEAAAGLLAGD